ncbi:MAG: replication factor C large subunit [Nanoarchaeota archaeon]|nr:replication factor C large subunit [Nanoarchaeota archaeon]
MLPFTEKYKVSTLSDIQGQDQAVAAAKNLLSGKGKALFLYGPPGTGKTSLAIALASDSDLEFLEFNASDHRNANTIKERVGGALGQQSLFSKGKLILIDEVDGLSGTKDRGGIKAIVDLIKKSPFPLVITAQDSWNRKFSTLRKHCELIAMPPLHHDEIAKVLTKVCDTEKIKYEPSIVTTLARRAGGDCRAALTDLQSMTQVSKSLTKEALDQLVQRSQIESMPQALVKVFKTTNPEIAISAFEQVVESSDDQFLWIDENLPKEYSKAADIERAYEAIGKADVFRRRIRRLQHWRFLVYINALLTASIAVAKDEKYKTFVQYKPTGRILKLWWAKQKSMKKKAIAAKLGAASHTSGRQMLPYMDHYKSIFQNNKEMGDAIASYADLDKEEIAWLKK